jgi:hypothetical protein
MDNFNLSQEMGPYTRDKSIVAISPMPFLDLNAPYAGQKQLAID